MNDPYATAAPSPEELKSSVASMVAADHPKQIGRYRIEKLLGEGGFGRVYLARDDQLERGVAIKVPRFDRFSQPLDAAAYLAEARVLASLDHSNIVPVHDVGETSDGLCYVVSKFIEGSDLAKKMRTSRFSYGETASLVATVAEALHYAHRQGLVHRDIKPGNILIDTSGKTYVADFGLALKREDFGKLTPFGGTPAYMSPEQARGEGHKVDGRSDIFSLGVVFYELLVGRRPFEADSLEELLEQIASVEARPPRQVDDHIPKELECICLKALSKRVSERYTTAKDLADGLSSFLACASAEEKSRVADRRPRPADVATHVESLCRKLLEDAPGNPPNKRWPVRTLISGVAVAAVVVAVVLLNRPRVDPPAVPPVSTTGDGSPAVVNTGNNNTTVINPPDKETPKAIKELAELQKEEARKADEQRKKKEADDEARRKADDERKEREAKAEADRKYREAIKQEVNAILAVARLHKGQPAELERYLGILKSVGSPAGRGKTYSALGLILAEQKKHAEARAAFQNADAQYKTINDDYMRRWIAEQIADLPKE